MEIEYCNHYQGLVQRIKQTRRGSLEGLPEVRIAEIESAINNGNALPKALREFLYIGVL